MTLTVAQLDEIERGCEGVTPGPWREENQPFGSAIYIKGGKTIATAHGSLAITKEKLPNDLNAEHIARLSPEVVRELCQLAREGLTMRQDYEAATDSHLAHVRDLDVAMNGDGAAKRPLLIDIKEQILCIVQEARFLVDRLNEIEPELEAGIYDREYMGHVAPSKERLAMLLEPPLSTAVEGDEGK